MPPKEKLSERVPYIRPLASQVVGVFHDIGQLAMVHPDASAIRAAIDQNLTGVAVETARHTDFAGRTVGPEAVQEQALGGRRIVIKPGERYPGSPINW